MREYRPVNVSYSESNQRGFITNNLNAISASILSIISRSNSTYKKIKELENRIEELEAQVEALTP
jgi:peptidoglycan hydrolase CwlO-like protein